MCRHPYDIHSNIAIQIFVLSISLCRYMLMHTHTLHIHTNIRMYLFLATCICFPLSQVDHMIFQKSSSKIEKATTLPLHTWFIDSGHGPHGTATQKPDDIL